MDNSIREFYTVSETEDYVVVYKPHDIPTVPLKHNSGQETLLGKVSSIYPKTGEKYSENWWEGGALHRLDAATSGLVMFAQNREFFYYMTMLQKKGGFIKIYSADVSCLALNAPKSVETYFRAYGEGRKIVRPELDVKKADSKILYKTDIENISEYNLKCIINRGFRHQIRSHLAYIGLPIVGDSLYGGREDSFLHLECTGLCFEYKGKKSEISL